jgi:putative ABC transport system ATP-binding protein
MTTTGTLTSTSTLGTASPLLQARGVGRVFDGHAVLHGVDLDVGEGELVSVMGPSGSGKTTLLYSLSGMDRVSSGRVVLAGRDLTALGRKELARLRLTTMGFVFQHVHLLRNLCLLDNVVLPAFLAGLAPRAELVRRAMGLLERTGVAELAHRDVTEASGGQLQRVGICRALINEPTVIFADEPTGALDSTAGAGIMDLLCEVNEEGTTVVLVTHDASVAARTHRVLSMVDGRVVGDRDQGRPGRGDLTDRTDRLVAWLREHNPGPVVTGGPPTGPGAPAPRRA